MTRFEGEYNPTIFYDASCRAKEMGLNREPERFLKIKFASDPLHIENHTTCSASFSGLDNLASFPINIQEDF